MTTSGSSDFSVSRSDIIKDALLLCGAIASGESPTADETVDASRVLNRLIKAWQARGVGLWLLQQCDLIQAKNQYSYDIGTTQGKDCSTEMGKAEIAVAAVSTDTTITVDSSNGIVDTYHIGVELDDGTIQWTTVNGAPVGNVVTLAAGLTDDAAVGNFVFFYPSDSHIPRPLEIIECRRVTADDIEIPLNALSRAEYLALSDKTSTGPAVSYYYDPQLSMGKLYLWPACGDVKERVRFTARRPLYDYDANDNTSDFPVEWEQAIVYSLAVRLAPMYEVSPTKLQVLKQESAEYLDEAMGFDHEPVSVVFQPSRGF